MDCVCVGCVCAACMIVHVWECVCVCVYFKMQYLGVNSSGCPCSVITCGKRNTALMNIHKPQHGAICTKYINITFFNATAEHTHTHTHTYTHTYTHTDSINNGILPTYNQTLK